MKKLTQLICLVLFCSFGIGTYANAAERITPQVYLEPAYLERDASEQVASDLAAQLTDEIYSNLGKAGFELLRSVNTRDGFVVLLRYFAENCEECRLAAKLSENVMPTNVTNAFLPPERAVSPTLDSRLTFTSDDNQTAWEWFPNTSIKAKDLGCLNCIGVHCP